MERTILSEKKNESCDALRTSVYETQSRHAFQNTKVDSRKDMLSNNSNSFLEISEIDNTCDLISHSEEESSLFGSEQFEGLLPGYERLPSLSKLNKFKETVSEVNAKYLDWIITELVLSKYKAICSEMPAHIAIKIKHVITSSTVQPSSAMKNRRGETLTLLGLGEDDLSMFLKKSLLSSEKKELSKRMINVLRISINKLKEERKKLKGVFGNHCLKVIAPDTCLSEERVQQAQMTEQLRLRLDRDCQTLISSSEMMHQLAHLEVDSMRQLQIVSYSSLKNKARLLCSNISILRNKIDQISLADVNHTRAMTSVGKRLRTSVDELSEKRKRLLKLLEKYERKENVSTKFNEIRAEYAKTKQQLDHKLQTLQFLNEPDTSFS